MRKIALTLALGAGLAGLAACGDGGGNAAANEANDTLDANGVDASGGVNAGGVGAGGGAPATDADGDGDLDVDVNLKVPEPKLEVGPDGVTVNAGDDPGVSVTTNGN
jgi:hypothetical protein